MDLNRMDRDQHWPQTIWVARHGESAGNVAWEEAEAAGVHLIDLEIRDADVPLSERGGLQSRALGRWFGKLPPDRRPTVILTSTYVRTRSTAELIFEAAGLGYQIPIMQDERLREKEFGVLDRLTAPGIEANFPDQAEFRRVLGKFYHRPPGGESWCDVILRLRSVIDTLTRDYCRERVLIVCHSVVVLCFRYLFERLTEDEILAIDRQGRIANCSLTSYEFMPDQGPHGGLALQLFNFVAPLEDAGAPVTREPDTPVGPK